MPLHENLKAGGIHSVRPAIQSRQVFSTKNANLPPMVTNAEQEEDGMNQPLQLSA